MTEQIFTSQVLCDGKTECQSLAAAGQVARNHILAVVHRIKGVLLNWEKRLDASGDELLGGGGHDLREGSELSVGHVVGLELLRSALLTGQARVFARITSTVGRAFTLLSRRVHRSAPGGLLGGCT